MKCPNCGAEIKTNAKSCEFCGSSVTIQMRREQEQLNKSGCPKCGSSNISFSREKQGELRGTHGTAVIRSTVGVCKDCGYTWQTDGGTTSVKKRSTWLWVLGWICIFPLPLTILFLRKKEMKPAIKYGIVAVAWIVYFVIGLGGKIKNANVTTNVDSVEKTEIVEQNFPASTQQETTNGTSESEHNDGAQTPEDAILYFVECFNSGTEDKLVFNEGFTPSDKASAHYRTEFRLNAYSNAVGKSYTYKNAIVDIVACQSIFGEVTYRVYMLSDTFDDVVEMVETASPIMDSTITATELKDTLACLSENKSANGYYYGKLGMGLVRSNNNGYELMIKMD